MHFLMNRKLLFVAILVIALVLPVAGPVFRFLTHYGEIVKLVETADPSEQKLPESVRQLLAYSLQDRASSYAAQLLIRRFDGDSYSGRTVLWNITYATWSSLVDFVFSKDEQLEIVSRLAPTGNESVGLVNASHRIFNLGLSEISLAQAAELVVLVKAPSAADHPEVMSRERERLLLKYQGRNAK